VNCDCGTFFTGENRNFEKSGLWGGGGGGETGKKKKAQKQFFFLKFIYKTLWLLIL